ncbi:MAG TPA: hypothetical protein VKV20_07835 [Ktedonobacteraceae bacterium]|nr:hypothetical protein [Ktedonobacteraceae bacterium]
MDIDILYLVDRLENLVTGSRRMPLTNQIMIRESDILSIIDQMRTSIPDEIKQARRIIQDKERIMAQAQADANKLMARAREESERAINREGLLRVAEERSQEMLRQAEASAEQLKTEADAYIAETLRGLRDHLASIEMEVGRSILSIEKGLASLELSPEDEENAEDDDSGESGDDYDDYEQQANASPSRPVPRRSSLAVDTRGGPMYSQDSSSYQ